MHNEAMSKEYLTHNFYVNSVICMCVVCFCLLLISIKSSIQKNIYYNLFNRTGRDP